jgi:hypothetical protein
MQANSNEKSDAQSNIRGDIYALAFFSIPCFLLSVIGWQHTNQLAEKQTTFLQTARSQVISIDSDTINPPNEGQLVYVKGMMKPRPEILTDPYFNVSTKAFALVRQVKKGKQNSVNLLPYDPNLNNTYHSNPCPTMVWRTEETKLGAYNLTWDQVFPLFNLRKKKFKQDIHRLESIRHAAIPMPLMPELRDQLSAQWGDRLVVNDKEWSIQFNDQHNTQIQFLQFDLPTMEVSILAQQRGNGFVPCSSNGDTIFEIKIGSHDVESLFSIAQQRQMANIYFSQGLYLLLFATGLALVLQAFVPRKRRDENGVATMNSSVESSADHKQRILIETEPFLLHQQSSQSFLAGEVRDIRNRFQLDDQFTVPKMLLAGLAVIFVMIMLLRKVVEFNFQTLRTPETQANIVFLLVPLIYSAFWAIRKLKTNSATDCMIRHGIVLQGSIRSCTGKTSGNGEVYWYSVKVEYEFSNPQKIQLRGECKSDRDDLSGLPLPKEGTAVLVLYLDDKTYALL